MYRYELLCVLANKYSDPELTDLQGRIIAAIDKCGGSICAKTIWAHKQLSYKIDHSKIGSYFRFDLEAGPKSIASINRTLLLTSEILRHQLTKKIVRSVNEIAGKKALRERIALKQADTLKKAEGKPKILKKILEIKTEQVEAKVSNVPIEDLGKKIDDLLAEELT